MAYTYDDFVSAASKAGMLETFSQHDLQTAQKNPEFGLSLLSLKQDSAKATTAEQRLLVDEAANQLRKTYGNYTIGSDGTASYAENYGSEVADLLSQIRSYGSFKYDNENAYQKLLDTVANQEAFEYDPATDPQFSSVRKAYLREGERATANALAKAAAANGGRVSSWAAGAAAQAGNYYAGQVADMIPTLRQNAYTEYLNKISSNLSALSALESDRTFDYQTYLGELDKLKTTLGNYQTQEATNYARYLDLWSQAAQAEQLAREQEQREYDNALNLLQALGYATPEVAQTLGLNTDTAGTTNGAAVPNDSTVSDPAQNQGVKGYDNGDLEQDEIVEMQGALGLDTDGKWGPESQAEALAEWGFRSADDAWEYYVNNIKNPDTSNFTVTNRNGNGWVAIGNSRMTWPELEKAVNQGKIIEVIDRKKGTITYQYASTGKTK